MLKYWSFYKVLAPDDWQPAEPHANEFLSNRINKVYLNLDLSSSSHSEAVYETVVDW